VTDGAELYPIKNVSRFGLEDTKRRTGEKAKRKELQWQMQLQDEGASRRGSEEEKRVAVAVAVAGMTKQ